MFTGIIERTLKVAGVIDHAKLRRLSLAHFWSDLRHGESIAVNGVCLTIAELDSSFVHFDVIQETLDKTNLGALRADSRVNVERAMKIGDRIDGHFVQGHVDCTGEVVEQRSDGGDWRLVISTPAEFRKYLAPKGSITIDGVSLTLAAVRSSDFEVALIPTTLELTNLADKKAGDRVNLEADILAKTVVNYMELRGN